MPDLDKSAPEPAPDSAQKYIWRPWRRLPNGTVQWAKHHGLKAWKIPVSDNDNGIKTAV